MVEGVTKPAIKASNKQRRNDNSMLQEIKNFVEESERKKNEVVDFSIL